MSRVRLPYALGLLGILITTGGCAESATAPTMDAASFAESRGARPATPADSVSNPQNGTDDGVTVQSGGFLQDGGRAAP